MQAGKINLPGTGTERVVYFIVLLMRRSECASLVVGCKPVAAGLQPCTAALRARCIISPAIGKTGHLFLSRHYPDPADIESYGRGRTLPGGAPVSRNFTLSCLPFRAVEGKVKG